MARRSRLRAAPSVAIAIALVAGALLAAMAGSACITTPPPDLPELPDQPPSIWHDAVFPPEGILTEWPEGGQFTIPVRMAKPGETFFYTVIYDYGTANQSDPVPSTQAAELPDGGTELIPLVLKAPSDKAICPHQIEFVVAARFQSDGTPNAIGGDLARWTYVANGTPSGCPSYDAGNGAFPEGGDQ